MQGSNALTHSRVSCFKTCLRKHFFSYELGLRRRSGSRPIRMGSAVHLGLEAKDKGASADQAIEKALEPYATVPANVDPYEWQVEYFKVMALLYAHFSYYSEDAYKFVAPEMPFEIPIRNPESGHTTNVFVLRGKIDGIVELPDGRLAVLERKTTGDTIEDADSDYWKRLRLDHQITNYVYAARRLGFEVQTVMYDVLRKPSIEPTKVPVLDTDGLKVVLDGNRERVLLKNGKPRQSADRELGYILQTEPEKPEEYYKRLMEDITTRPGFYLQRREIARLHTDITEYELELWQTQQSIRSAQKSGHWFRNTGACTRPFKCEFFDVCLSGVNPQDQVPDGYEVVSNVHPELGENENGEDCNA